MIYNKWSIHSVHLHLTYSVRCLRLWASQGVLVVKNLPTSAGDVRDAASIPGSGRSPEKGTGNPLQYSCLENPMDKGAWWTTVHSVGQSWTWLKWPSTHAMYPKFLLLELITSWSYMHKIYIYMCIYIYILFFSQRNARRKPDSKLEVMVKCCWISQDC